MLTSGIYEMSVQRNSICRTRLGIVLAATAAALLTTPAWMDVAHGGQDQSVEEEWLIEPFFVARSTPESEIEFEVEYENFSMEDEIGLGLGLSWAPVEWLQLGVEVPAGIRIPDDGPTVADLGDVEFSALLRLSKLDKKGDGLSFALLGEVAAPTGDEGKEIGGTGSWGIFGTGGFTVPLDSDGMRMGVQFQVGYEQQIHLTDEQREEAMELGVPAVLEKEIVWGAAANVPFELDGDGHGGKLVPSLEVVGHTVLDAIESDEEGTIVEVGGGVWWEPPESSLFGGLEFGLAAKGPVSGMKESNYTVLFVVKAEMRHE